MVKTRVTALQIARGSSLLDTPVKSSITAESPASFCICSVMYRAACCSSSVPAGRGPISWDRYATCSMTSAIMFAFRSSQVLYTLHAYLSKYTLLR